MTKHDKAPFRGVARVRADASDPVSLVGQIKAAFEEFKAANDQRIKALEKGKADALLDAKVDGINATISELQGQLADVASRAAASTLSGGGAQGDEAAQAHVFARHVRRPEVSLEEYREYRNAQSRYIRSGNAGAMNVLAAMSVDSDPNGGYTVTPDVSGRIVSRIYETTPMRQLASVVTIGTDALEGFNDLDEAAAEWVGERAARNETATPTLGKWSIPVHEIAAQPKATQKLLDDSAFDIEGWLAGKVADKFSRAENAAFLTGDGIEKPRGLLTYPTAATADASRAWGTFEHVNTTQNGSFGTAPNGSDKLIDLVFAVKADFRNGASWLMSRATLAAVRKLKDGDGNYLWQPDFAMRQGGLLLGYPVAEGEDMPAFTGTNALGIAFGNFAQAYTIVDRLGIRVLRDPFTDKPHVRFYTTRRVGGAAINFEAVKFLRFGS
jgi:HK97 family phage major capsid protein